jgi:type-F conjugative transfer system pilin assembly protein TrbC
MEEKELLHLIKNKLRKCSLLWRVAAIFVIISIYMLANITDQLPLISQAKASTSQIKGPSISESDIRSKILDKAMKNADKARESIKNTRIASPDMESLKNSELIRDEAKEKVEEQAKSSTVREIAKAQEELRTSESFKRAQKFAKEVLRKNETAASFSDATGDIITEKGVDLYEMSNRYINEFNKSKHNASEKLKGLYVLISTSLPEGTMKEIAVSSREAGATLILRGMKEGSMASTAAFVKALHDKGVRAAIHPKIFEMLQVEVVPCYVLIEEREKQGYMHDKICGNISLEYALNEFASRGDLRDVAGKHLDRLRGAR